LNAEIDIVEFLKKIRRFEAFTVQVSKKLNLRLDKGPDDSEIMRVVESDDSQDL